MVQPVLQFALSVCKNIPDKNMFECQVTVPLLVVNFLFIAVAISPRQIVERKPISEDAWASLNSYRESDPRHYLAEEIANIKRIRQELELLLDSFLSLNITCGVCPPGPPGPPVTTRIRRGTQRQF